MFYLNYIRYQLCFDHVSCGIQYTVTPLTYNPESLILMCIMSQDLRAKAQVTQSLKAGVFGIYWLCLMKVIAGESCENVPNLIKKLCESPWLRSSKNQENHNILARKNQENYNKIWPENVVSVTC